MGNPESLQKDSKHAFFHLIPKTDMYQTAEQILSGWTFRKINGNHDSPENTEKLTDPQYEEIPLR